MNGPLPDRPKRDASECLRALIANPGRASALRLWRCLEGDERAAVARAFIEAQPTGDDRRENLVHAVAAARNFRPVTVRKWPDSKIVDAMKRVPVRDSRRVADLIRHLPQVPHRRPMARQFAAFLGLEAPEAVFDAAVDVPEDKVRGAADALLDEYGQREVVLYFLVVVLREAKLAESLRAWLREPGEVAPVLEADLSQETDEERPPAEDVAEEPGRERTFTTLDLVLFRAVVDAKHGVEGALTEDQVDDMVDEYVSLNGRRHRSHFHAGFRDTLFERPVDAPAQDRPRARWYWAGAMQGWARSESWERIVEEYDKQELVQGLGDASDASAAAVGQIVRALREQGRVDELAKFVRPSGLAALPSAEVFESLLEVATGLLRDGDAATALHIFELLERAAKRIREGDSFSNDQLFLDARRRRAHCLRELDRPDEAGRILKGLLKLDATTERHAMVQADLGLLEGGFRNLDDVQLPRRRESLEGLKQQLEAGRSHFERAVENNVRYASHGHYCLGVLALCKNEYGRAQTHLDQARTFIAGGTGHYNPGLKARIVLYLGIATILAVTEPNESDHGHSDDALRRVCRGAHRMAEGLDEGAAFPPYLVGESMAALDLGSKPDMQRVAELVLKKGDEHALAALADSDPAIKHCESLSLSLFKRACSPGRRKTDAVADLHKALRGFLRAESVDNALEVLDRLEGYAFEGIGTDEFIELLRADDYGSLPVDVEDARVAHASCLEARGETEDAAQVLGSVFHRLTTAGRMSEAEDLLLRIKKLRVPALHASLEKRLAGVREDSAVREEEPRYDAKQAVNVLIVGGDDERQSKRVNDQVCAAVRRKSAAIKVEFIRSGWSADWGRHMQRAERLLGTHDAVVIMRFMRTHFGRKLREACSKANRPWYFCWGGGSEAQARAVVEAAHLVVASKTKPRRRSPS